MSTPRIGQFVKTTENDLGVGKVDSIDDDWITIEYFDSPTSDRAPIRVLPASVVQPTELHEERRVYFQHPDTLSWYIGRALVKRGEEYRVQFPNRKVVELPESSLYARWNRPIEEPTDHLAHQVNETPYFHDGRAPFMASLIEQRAACAGMTGLFSSTIELEEHQIEVVRRVLQDPIQRYLLADEVGLGKTIEAGAIMRQYALDRPKDFNILVVVPQHLTDQWRVELRQRFLFDQELGDQVNVIPYADDHKIRAFGEEAGMLVIDEAHQIARYASSNDPSEKNLYAEVKSIAERVNRLLLLSATPVLHNEAGYLAMLHLLDPVMYPLDDVDSFRKKIQKRQEVAEVFYSFTSETDDYFLEQLTYELQDHFPNDSRLLELTQELLPHLDFSGDVDAEDRERLVRAIRTHISETYRLHRRMLRTRRTEETQWILPGRTELRALDYDDPHAVETEQLLEEWRSEAAASVYGREGSDIADGYANLFRCLFEASSGLPQTLKELVQDRLVAISQSRASGSDSENKTENSLVKLPSFGGEEDILRNLVSVLGDAVAAKRRLSELRVLLEAVGKEAKKVVVFLDRKEDADTTYGDLQEEFGSAVARHSGESDTPEESWKRFLESSDCHVLVCDHRAEEGINLQKSEAQLVHLDVPLSPNRLEQRIGRLDRFGSGSAVESVIFVPRNSMYLGRLVELQVDGFDVFERSIASLQYLVEDKMNELWPRVFLEGPEVIDSTTEKLGGEDGEVAQELKRVEAQDELDALEASAATDTDFYDRLWDVDFDAEHLEEVAYEWIRKRVQFHREDTAHDDERMMRWRFRTDRSAKHPTLLPIRDLLTRFATAVDPNVDGYASYPMSFRRQTACSKKVRVARLGEPFISAMMKYTRWDDRGISYAMWRHFPRAELSEDTNLFFRFDFLIEADIRDAVDALDDYDDITPESVRLRGDRLFPPMMRTVWVDERGNAVDDETVRELLEEPYDQDGIKRIGSDYNLNFERWEEISDLYDDSSWSSTCWDVRKKAERQLVEDVELQELSNKYAERASKQAQESEERLKTRIEQTSGSLSDFESRQLELEQTMNDALEDGVRNPNIRLDSIGAEFLSTIDPFDEIK